MRQLTKNPGVYKITCTANQKFYIGSSVDIRNRIRRHFRDLTNNIHGSSHLQNAFNKYGEECFIVEIITEYEKGTITLKELHRVEQKYLDETKCYDREVGFNTCNIAGSPSQTILSEEHRKKISKSMTGHKHSDETKKKISEGKKGKRNPQEAIDRMRLTKIGLKQSEENINKRARHYSFVGPDGTVYQGTNLKRFCDEHNLHRSNMVMILNGKRESHHGFKKF